MSFETQLFTSEVQSFTSSFNGQKIYFNPHRIKYGIISHDLEAWRTLFRTAASEMRPRPDGVGLGAFKSPGPLRQAFADASEASSLQEAFLIFERMLSHYKGKATFVVYAICLRFMMRAYSSGLILFPIGTLAGAFGWYDEPPLLKNAFFGEAAASIGEVYELFLTPKESTKPVKEKFLKPLIGPLLSMSLKTPEDASVELAAAMWQGVRNAYPPGSSRQRGEQALAKIFRHFETLLRKKYPGKDIIFVAPNLVKRGPKPKLENGTDFAWIVRKAPDLHVWAKAFNDYVVASTDRRIQVKISQLKLVANYLLALPEDQRPATPSDLSLRYITQRHGSPSVVLIPFLRQQTSDGVIRDVLLLLRRFLEEWRDQAGLSETWHNPIRDKDMPRPPAAPSKTTKDAIPVEIIRRMIRIITANNYEWPRKAMKSDLVRVKDEHTGRYRFEWCPVRAVAILSMLMVPIRSIQLRLLDSGEKDEETYDVQKNVWTKNEDGEAGRQAGVIRRFYDSRSKREIVGLWINTNKSPVDQDTVGGGYGIPWENRVLLEALDMLAKWQKRFNPVSVPLAPNELMDPTLRSGGALEGRMPGFYYLFRDPTNPHRPDNPVTYKRLSEFFLSLLAKVEEEMRADDPNITLIRRSGLKSRTADYSLHSLRVTGITHFLEAGVPIQIVADFLAGHSSILMTVYYDKISPGKVTDAIDKAWEAIEQGKDHDWAQHLATLSMKQLVDEVAFNDLVAVQELADTRPGLWSLELDGLCPVGKSLCHVGGPRTTPAPNSHGPVPGGPRNCPRCRFFITGPAFLAGQVVAYNLEAYSCRRRVRELNGLQNQLAELEAKGNVSKRVLERYQSRIDSLEIEVDTQLTSLQVRYRLVERSRGLLHAQHARGEALEGKFGLIALGGQEDLELGFETPPDDFYLVEFAAQSYEKFPDKADSAGWMEKARWLDVFLERNGESPIFYALPEEEAVAAGNILTRFLAGRIGQDGVRKLLNGMETLASLDAELAADFSPLRFLKRDLAGERDPRALLETAHHE